MTRSDEPICRRGACQFLTWSISPGKGGSVPNLPVFDLRDDSCADFHANIALRSYTKLSRSKGTWTSGPGEDPFPRFSEIVSESRYALYARAESTSRSRFELARFLNSPSPSHYVVRPACKLFAARFHTDLVYRSSRKRGRSRYSARILGAIFIRGAINKRAFVCRPPLENTCRPTTSVYFHF